MSYTSAADTIVQAADADIDATLELKTNFSSSNTFSEYDYKSLTIRIRDGAPRELSAELLNTSFDFSDETNQAIRTQMKAIARVTVNIGSESEVKFYGRINSLNPQDEKFIITARCLMQDLMETECDPYVEPSTQEVVDESTRRALTVVDAAQPHVFGFVDDNTGTDAAFRQGGSSPRPRRSWERRPIRVWTHASETGDDYQLTGTKFHVDWTSGVILIYEAEGDLLSTYYVDNVSCYQESVATGATNCDYARIFQEIITHPAQRGGPGFVLGTDWGNAITAVSTGSKTITVSGNFVDHYPDGCQIYMQENSASDPLTLTVNGTPSYSSGSDETTVTVNESIATMSVADGYISRDTGLDLDRGFGKKDTCSKMLTMITEEAQENLKYWYEPETLRFRYETVEQAGSADYTLVKPKMIAQPRDVRDWYTRIVRTGKTSFPVNDVAEAAADSGITDITTGGNYFRWDGANVGADSTFASIIPYVYDGDGNIGASVHNLNSTADVDGTTGDKYKGYYYFFKVDLGEVKNVDRVRIHMPGSRNEKAKAGHQGIFWPGVKLEISDDDSTYYTMSVDAYGRYEPGSVIDFDYDRMQRGRGRYIRVLCGAYKHGFEDQSDPSIGIAELEVWTNVDYEVVREISPLHDIITANTVSDYFEITGDYLSEWEKYSTFTVIDSTGNNGNYAILSVALNGSNTRINVDTGTKAVASSTADGRLYTTTDYEYLDGDTVQRHYPDLWDRNGYKQKESRKDFGTKYSEAIAGDIALATFEESIRLFQEVDFKSVCDPRPRIWKTLSATDEMNGNVTFLCQDLTLRFGRNMNSEFNGVNYNSSVPV